MVMVMAFLAVKLATPGMNYNPSMEGIPVRFFFWQEITALILAAPSARSLDKRWKNEAFVLCLSVLSLVADPSLH